MELQIVKLTRMDGNPIYVNLKNMCTMWWVTADTREYTNIYFRPAGFFEVRETPEQILNKLAVTAALQG